MLIPKLRNRSFLIYIGLYPELAIVIALSIIGTVILAKLVGAMLPMAAKAVKLDPAIMATPLITTVVDSCSLLIYFTIATTILADRLQ